MAVGRISIQNLLPSKLVKHTIHLEEDERQAVLLALAELSIARPGWLHMLEIIALKMDNRAPDGKAEVFEAFRLNHSNALAKKLAEGPAPDLPGYPAQW